MGAIRLWRQSESHRKIKKAHRWEQANLICNLRYYERCVYYSTSSQEEQMENKMWQDAMNQIAEYRSEIDRLNKKVDKINAELEMAYNDNDELKMVANFADKVISRGLEAPCKASFLLSEMSDLEQLAVKKRFTWL